MRGGDGGSGCLSYLHSNYQNSKLVIVIVCIFTNQLALKIIKFN